MVIKKIYHVLTVKRVYLFILPLLVISCSDESDHEIGVDDRWYTPSQVNNGRTIFRKNCARCHGSNTQGTPDWKQTLPDGSYPPPPLNGSAHTWHHSLSVLKRTINDGGIPLGGKMPAFKNKLSASDISNTIAFIQSHWSDDIYNAWIKRDGLK